MTALEFTKETLDELKIKYHIEDNTLIIHPTSSPMLEMLPGNWIQDEETGAIFLHCSIDSGDLMTPKYLAGLIRYCEDFI